MIIVSFSRYGYEGEIIKVEADLRRGIPAIDIVGLPDGAVREARERMRAAIRNSGFEFPRERILINLSPADLKKEGSSFDLPIALAVLGIAQGICGSDESAQCGGTDGGKLREPRVMVLGELELSGTVRPVRGILSAVSRGIAEGITDFIVPEGNLAEATIRHEASVTGVGTLIEAVSALRSFRVSGGGDFGNAPGMPVRRSSRTQADSFDPGRFPETGEPGFEDVRGQPVLVRAIEIAAAGGHNLVAYGPPGCGKTLALARMPALLPDMDGATAITATRIHSIAGTLPDERTILARPPFRTPHTSASIEGMTGGGKRLIPGEISLAHGGTLFLDEAALFRATVLQALRAPLETGTVTVSRAGKAATFPARFQLLMTMNPCPCGNFGAPGAVCTCAPDAVEKYWRRLAAPLLDRIELRIAVGRPPAGELASGDGFSTGELRKEIAGARRIQWERARGRTRPERDIWTDSAEPEPCAQEFAAPDWLNANLTVAGIARHCALGAKEEKIFVECMKTARFSARAGHGVLKVARTIADLAGKSAIGEEHLLEAARLRQWGPFVPDFLREER